MILHGICPPMITPLLARDTLDLPGLERLIERILSGGVHSLFLCGTTGEGPNLSYRLRLELIERTCRQVAGRVPVLVGITDTSFVEAVDVARRAADCGVQAVVVAPPYYFPMGQPELLEYLKRLVAALPLPVFLYNMPEMTKINIEPKTLRQLLDEPRIVGFKDSSGDICHFQKILDVAKDRPDWNILMGPDLLLSRAVCLGGHGGICSGANLNPRLFVDLYEAAKQGDTARVAELQTQVCELNRIYQVGQYASTVVKGLKCALSLLGVCNDFMAEPFHCYREESRERVLAILEKINHLVNKSTSLSGIIETDKYWKVDNDNSMGNETVDGNDFHSGNGGRSCHCSRGWQEASRSEAIE